MATAKQPGGLYYVNGVAVDAEGARIEDAPKQPKDTPPSDQTAATADPVQRLVDTLATALTGKAVNSAAVASSSASGSTGGSGASAEPPTLADLPDHIAKMSADEVKALQKSDARKGAAPIYEARLAELES